MFWLLVILKSIDCVRSFSLRILICTSKCIDVAHSERYYFIDFRYFPIHTLKSCWFFFFVNSIVFITSDSANSRRILCDYKKKKWRRYEHTDKIGQYKVLRNFINKKTSCTVIKLLCSTWCIIFDHFLFYQKKKRLFSALSWLPIYIEIR